MMRVVWCLRHRQTSSKTPNTIVAPNAENHRKHQARHDAPNKCSYRDCPRSIKGFATVNDLHRHKKSVHDENARNTKYYKCFASNCQKFEKEWPRLDNFKQHLGRMHPEENVDELVRR